jgi:hypothetical protein
MPLFEFLNQTKAQTERGRGRLTRRKQQSQAIVHYPTSTIGINLSPDVPKGADNLITTQFIRLYIGTRYSLSTLTIGNTYVIVLIDHYPLVHHLY